MSEQAERARNPVLGGVCRLHGPVMIYSVDGGAWRCVGCGAATTENRTRHRGRVRQAHDHDERDRNPQ